MLGPLPDFLAESLTYLQKAVFNQKTKAFRQLLKTPEAPFR